MKKFLAMLCMITCIFGLTACGSEEQLSKMDESNIEKAKAISSYIVVPYLMGFFDDALADEVLAEYNKEEMTYIVESDLSNVISYYSAYGHDFGVDRIYADGSGFISGISSFNSAYDTIGEVDLNNIGVPTAKISGKEIIVYVPITGANKNATAEIIFSNDIFLTVKAAALNPEATMGEGMVKATLNTIMGMGTVFVVLILISLIISAMAFIPKLQAKLEKKKKQAEVKTIKEEAVDNTIAQIIEKEELSDDLELVAVIAAAIAASQGATSTDGFVVRSIRKVRR